MVHKLYCIWDELLFSILLVNSLCDISTLVLSVYLYVRSVMIEKTFVFMTNLPISKMYSDGTVIVFILMCGVVHSFPMGRYFIICFNNSAAKWISAKSIFPMNYYTTARSTMNISILNSCCSSYVSGFLQV